MTHPRTRITTTDETYDEGNHYTSSQPIIPMTNNDVK